MGRAGYVIHLDQRMIRADYRFFFVNIDRGHARTPRSERIHQRIFCDQSGSAGVYNQCRRFHACQIIACHNAASIFVEWQMQTQDVHLSEKLLAALGHFKTGGSGAAGGTLAPPADHSGTERFADAGDDTADFSVGVNAQRFAVNAYADSRLPFSFFELLDFIRQATQSGENQPPSQLSRRVRIAGASRRHDDSLFCASFQIDMRRRPPGLADKLEPGQPFNHRARESRTLLGEHNHLGIFEPFGELRWIFFGVRVYDDLMATQFGITSKCFEGVLIIIDDYDLHESFLLLKLLSFSLRKCSNYYSLRTQPRSSRRPRKIRKVLHFKFFLRALRVLRGAMFLSILVAATPR